MFLPFFISFVIIGLIAYNILSYDYGLLNVILNFLRSRSRKNVFQSAYLAADHHYYVSLAVDWIWLDRIFRGDYGTRFGDCRGCGD